MEFTESQENGLKKIYNAFSKEDKYRFKTLVILGCDVVEQTFYNWLNDPTKIEKPYRQFICLLLKKKPSEIF